MSGSMAVDADIELDDRMPARCPSENTHDFPDCFNVGTFCLCHEWQIIEIKTDLPDIGMMLVCIDIVGKRQEFTLTGFL